MLGFAPVAGPAVARAALDGSGSGSGSGSGIVRVPMTRAKNKWPEGSERPEIEQGQTDSAIKAAKKRAHHILDCFQSRALPKIVRLEYAAMEEPDSSRLSAKARSINLRSLRRYRYRHHSMRYQVQRALVFLEDCDAGRVGFVEACNYDVNASMLSYEVLSRQDQAMSVSQGQGTAAFRRPLPYAGRISGG